MKVFLTGKRTAQSVHHRVTIAPAADPAYEGKEVSSSFVDGENKPREFVVNFFNGEATVADDLGKYMLARKMVGKTRLITRPEFYASF